MNEENKITAFVIKNELGYWVGCLKYPDGKTARVTNAKHNQDQALNIAQLMAHGANRAINGDFK